MKIKGVFDSGAPELIPGRIVSALKHGGKVVEGRSAISQIVCQKLSEAIRRKLIMVVYIDGLPGSGKSGVTERIADKVTKEGVIDPERIFKLPLDLFLGTERASHEREKLTQSGPEFFQRHYLRYEEAAAVLDEMVDRITNGDSGNILLPKAYLRDGENRGKFGEYTLRAEKGTRLILVEGAGSIHNIATPRASSDECQTYSVLMHATNEESLFRATLRDMLDGRNGMTFEQVYMRRQAEYQHLIPRLMHSIRESDVICERFPKKNDFAKSLVRREEELAAEPENGYVPKRSIRRIIAAVDPTFLKAIFPGSIPEKLISG
ncbi:MAG: hypothetical protein NTX63_00905 [Candidatus Peregrinibacteria bacterium]|nr:hypothetical protein [Candidatus Peregrinibacteria bacterium]